MTDERTALAAIWLFVARGVRSFPTHKDSKRGRKNAMQIRIALLAIGISCIAFGSSLWAIVGLIICVIPLLIPVETGKRTAWISSLKRNATTRLTTTTDGVVSRDKNKILVETEKGSWQMSSKKKVRRIIKDESAYLGFRDTNGNRFWFRCLEIPQRFPTGKLDPTERFRVLMTVDIETFEYLNG